MQIVVLGLRSGTSLVAHLLTELGVNMGHTQEEEKGNPQNPNGFFEDVEFRNINDAILEKAGGTWDDPPSWKDMEAIRGKEKKEIDSTIRRLIRQRNIDHPVWGWKDPRTCLTLPFYLDHLASDVRIVVVRRAQTHVIRSLQTQNPDLSSVQIKRIYLRYKSGIDQNVASRNRHLNHLTLYYDCLLSDPESSIEVLCSFVGERYMPYLSGIVDPELNRSGDRK